MHRLLKRQLKKIGYTDNTLSKEQLEKLISVINQTYFDVDEDRALLENTLSISSKEMQGLYEELKYKSQNELEQSEEKYGRLVKNLHNHYFFYTHDAEGVFTYISDSIKDILGYSTNEFLTHYEEYLTDDPINKEAIKYTNLSLEGKAQEPYELSIYHKDKSIRYLEVTEFPILNKDGNVEFIDGIARDISQQYEAQQKISSLAKHDVLTGLSNRLYLEEQLLSIISNASRTNKQFALLFLDLDHFKNINDTLGHDVGDKLLQEVTNRIQPNIRVEDIFARIGGDEFIIILTNINEIDLAKSLNKIIKLMRKTWKIDSYELKVSTSIGVALYPKDGDTIVELMKNADIAMYKAKEKGRDNFSFFTDELNQLIHEEMRLEQGMSNALATNQFELYYQPKQELIDDTIIGAEVLIRWNHPELGLIYPDKFISLTESTGFIVKLGRWIIKEACKAIHRFNTKDKNHKLHLSVNISTRQLQLDDLHNTIENALKSSNIDASQLSIEITESVMADNNEKLIKKLQDINAIGIKISLDDFGTGYSSLSYLNKLPINAFKIDKSFVDDIPKRGEKKILLDTIIAMGKALDMGVVAEGVEEEYQRNYLIKHGCIYYQGYLFSKPITEDEYFNLIS